MTATCILSELWSVYLHSARSKLSEMISDTYLYPVHYTQHRQQHIFTDCPWLLSNSLTFSRLSSWMTTRMNGEFSKVGEMPLPASEKCLQKHCESRIIYV